MGLRPYTKTHWSAAQCIAHVANIGLAVPDPIAATRIINEIGHNRLRIYFSARRDRALPGKPFVAGTSFSDVADIYRLDEHLRILMFGFTSKLEVIYKNRLSESLSSVFGAHPYFDDAAFNSSEDRIQALGHIMSALSGRTLKDTRTRHYYTNYNTPMLPPIWTVKEFLTFGSTNWFAKFLNKNIRDNIAVEMGLPNWLVLDRWMTCVIDLRNMCAHQNTIFNRSFQKAPTKVRRINIPSVTNVNSLAAIAECLEHLINQHSPGIAVCNDVRALVARHPAVRLNELGF